MLQFSCRFAFFYQLFSFHSTGFPIDSCDCSTVFFRPVAVPVSGHSCHSIEGIETRSQAIARNVDCTPYDLHLRRVELLLELHLRATGCHLPYGITQCYLPPNTSEHSPP